MSATGGNGGAAQNTVESYVPSRMDRLPFSRWHVLVIAALGITWVLDGLEVTIVGIVASVLTKPVSGLNLTSEQIGFAGGIYIAGAATGALFFSYLTDRYGRKKLFLITLGLYLAAMARIRKLGHESSSESTSRAVAPKRCSQLSKTKSNFRLCKTSASVSARDSAGRSGTSKTSASALGTSSCSERGANSTSHTPSE